VGVTAGETAKFQVKLTPLSEQIGDEMNAVVGGVMIIGGIILGLGGGL